MADWKNIGVPVIVALIAGTVSLISAYTSFITSSFFTPNIQISKESGGELNDIVRIDITNNGTAAAKGLRLTVQAPKDTSFIRFFSTEKYSENKTGDPTRLEMYVPRFAQGTGSLIRIESLSQNLTGLNQAAMENETGGQQQSNQTSNQTSNQSAGGGQQQSNQTSNQTSNQSAGGGQQQQQGNQSGSGLAQNETGGNETGGSILEQTGEAISKTFGDENGNETTIRNYTVYVTYDQGSVAKVIPLLSEVRPLSTQINIFISQYGFTIGYFIIGTTLVSFAIWFYKKRVTGGFRRAKIKEVRPRKISLRKEKNFITILGSNFGPTGTVWLEYYPPVTEDEMLRMRSFDDIDKVDEWIKLYRYQRDRLEYNYDITPKIAPTNALTRQDSRIITSLDDIITNLKSKEMGAIVKNGSLTYAISDAEYIVRVEKDGSLTDANSDATFTITNVPPKAEDLSYSTTLNEPVEIQLKATDPDADDQLKLTYIKVSDPTNGWVSGVDYSTGKCYYTPKAGFIGEDTFTFKANDGKDDSNTATVKIIIKQADL